MGASGGSENASPQGRSGPSASSGSSGRSTRGSLLDAVIEHFAVDGLADQSLRRIAEAIGTSHRMLLYHFGSKNGLLLDVVREVEARTRAQFYAVGEAARPEQTDELLRRMWHYVTDPALADFERLFFALYGRALQGDESVRPLLKDDIEVWLEANASVAATTGVPAEVSRTHARLGLAVTRGLLLDLLATGDRAGVESAFEAFADRYRGRWWEAEDQAPSSRRRAGTSDPAS